MPAHVAEELGAVPEIDLEDGRQIPILPHETEMQLHQPGKLLHRGLAREDVTLSSAPETLQARLEDLRQQVVLALEVEVDGAIGHTRGLGHVAHARAVETRSREGADGALEDALALGLGAGGAPLGIAIGLGLAWGVGGARLRIAGMHVDELPESNVACETTKNE